MAYGGTQIVITILYPIIIKAERTKWSEGLESCHSQSQGDIFITLHDIMLHYITLHYINYITICYILQPSIYFQANYKINFYISAVSST